MEERKQSGSSSFASDLFGSKEKESSASGIFESIFAPPSVVLGRESVRSESKGVEKKQEAAASQYSYSSSEVPENGPGRSEAGSKSMPTKDVSSYYQEEKVQPCHLSSSIYYGGPDLYSDPKDTQSSSYTTKYKKDGGEDDSDSASRGNWWQGSLYY